MNKIAYLPIEELLEFLFSNSNVLPAWVNQFNELIKTIKDFLIESVRSGVSQHWSIVPGLIAEDLKIVARWNDIAYSVLK